MAHSPLFHKTLLLALLVGSGLAGCQSASHLESVESIVPKGAPPLAAPGIMADFEAENTMPPPAFSDGEGERYDAIAENPFLLPQAHPLSTFAIDVDTASYGNVRRFLNDGQLPPRDAVRLEELINYFDYDYPQPQGDRPFAVTTEMGPAPWNPRHQLVQIGLQGKALAREDLPPNNLVFLLDVSGSMESPDKLPLLKSAFRLLVNELGPEDRVAIAVYAGSAGLVLPSTPGSEKDKILAALDRLSAGGSTAGAKGLELAYQEAQRYFLEGGNNRIILATDGDFNVGPASDRQLVELIEAKREAGVFLSVLGFGTGNIRDSTMEKLANHGNGNYGYIDSILEAKKILVTEMGGTLLTIAKDVKIQVEFNPAQVQAYRLIGYENRLLAAEDFNDDTKDAGELGAGHRVTALYEVIPVGVASDVDLPSVDDLAFTEPGAIANSGDWMRLKLRYKQPNGTDSQLLEHPLAQPVATLAETSDNFRFAAAVAEFGLLLRQSPHRGNSSWPQAIALAQGAQGADLHGYRQEFIRLLRIAQELSPNPD